MKIKLSMIRGKALLYGLAEYIGRDLGPIVDVSSQ